mmetsp:Transcript_27225/g.73575  ORF Transcript_27225/g.73575 Transcript_27225/m.73575 type:complete len:478 (-) Transcript_27225:810-2243(-)|eukprot:CAMPEP_0202418134 /NCGR_PEP_ID=MMETSP1128-20130828/45214_1 /ASSEMBLY_ACC=CAM_ASM_000463 /TAXON_ID=3047 /ORGANISM="Dunaliella tertiolecta, Strain CCMP1320" /LENGTH=477 /DNA_ID=CAMNT_0049025677 /DNA_START=77 /DNA_END=1510 /DNA_ORIENTATION=-
MIKQEPEDSCPGQDLQQVGLEEEEEDTDYKLPSISIPKLSGYIPNQPLPFNHDDYFESLTCGFVLHPSTSDKFVGWTQKWQQAAQMDQAKWNAIVTHGFEHQVAVNEAYKARFDGSPTSICSASALAAGVVRCFTMAGMGAPSEGLPPNMGLLGSLPAMESNTKMMGLVASQDLPKGFVLGPLCGYLMPAHIAAAELEEVPMNQDLKCTQERWRFECARYLFDVEASVPSNAGGSSLTKLSIWGMGYGGQGMLINDAVSNPISWCKAAAKKAKEMQSRGSAPSEAEVKRFAEAAKTYYDQGNNVEVVVVNVRGMPLPFLVCCRDIQQGEPFYMDYGLSWWQRHGDLKRSAAEAEEEAVESQGYESTAEAASKSGLMLLSELKGGASSAFVPPEQQGASVAFIDLTPPAPSPPPLVQLPASASCQKGSQLTAESTEQGSERTEDLVFGCLKDPGWKAYHMSLSAEVQKHWEAEQQGTL